MRRAGFHSRHVSFWALLAFVWQVLAMSGGSPAEPSSWAEACTPNGIVKVALGDAADTAGRAGTGTDCDWCQLMAGATEPGPVPVLVPRRPASRVKFVAVAAPQPASHIPWRGLPIRAPPVVG